MIKIIAKGYKYLLTQIDDFLGSVRTIVISLKSIKGRKEYEKLFGRKLDDQKTNIKIRIISLKQSRLTDFISNLFEKSMSRYSLDIDFSKRLLIKSVSLDCFRDMMRILMFVF